MERSTYPLTYKGSTLDAIIEAQKQKKLFVVYISGEDENSVNLEQSTWVDLSVAEAISQYCIFMHLLQGNVGASQFSEIYSQKSVPSISVVGYNGILLWKHEGYISAEDLVGNIEKAWVALHLLETAATLSATLPPKKSEPLGSSSHNAAPVEEVVSLTSDIPSTSAEKPVDDIMIDREEQSNSASNTIEEVLYPAGRDVDYSGATNDGGVSTEPQENLILDESHTAISEPAERMTTDSPGSSQITGNEVAERSRAEKADGLIDCSNALKTNDVHLNIRFPNGASLQAKFTVTDNLRSVKNYIDENQIGEIGSYDLAVPYPRKVFDEQDMNNALSELGFASRQALIVVPHHRATGHQSGQVPSSACQNAIRKTNSSDNNRGYFGYVKTVLSYMNPFSYLGGNASSSSSEASPSDTIWQYRAEAPRRPNPSSNQNPLPGDNGDNTRRRTSTPFGSNIHTLRHGEDEGPPGDNVDNTRRRTSAPFGSNIHTLRRDEDERPPGDRNTFWNGNSTEYGGNDK